MSLFSIQYTNGGVNVGSDSAQQNDKVVGRKRKYVIVGGDITMDRIKPVSPKHHSSPENQSSIKINETNDHPVETKVRDNTLLA